MDKLLSLKETEKLLNVSKSTLQRWDNSGKLKAIRTEVLRNMLLKQLDNGAFEPKKLKHEKVKEVLLSFRRNLQENVRSECIEGSMTTFDYV